MATPLLALPPAAEVMERTRQREAVVVGAGLWGLSALLVLSTLVGAFTAFRSSNGGLSGFRPDELDKFNYMASMLLAASAMLVVAAEWLVWGVRKDERRQAGQAAGLSVAILLAMLTGDVEIARRLGSGAGDSIYTTIAYAFLVAAAVTIGVALAAQIAILVRLGGRQVGPAEPQLARAVAIVSYVPAITWVVIWSTIYAAAR